MTINDNKAIPENLVLSCVNIINFEEMLLTFLTLRRRRIYEVRLQNLYLALCKLTYSDRRIQAPRMEPYDKYQ